jgi:acyl-CoA synthetase (AMP-forming)/AMP-acid ligase II
VNGYFRSGDLAVLEPDGMIRIVGRRSVDIIKSRGFKISAVEIENCLQAHPAVAEVAVVGVPETDQGEAVTAVITTAPGATLSAEQVRAHARAHLAPHKVPSSVVFVDEIPRTGPGKFKKRELIERLKERDQET